MDDSGAGEQTVTQLSSPVVSIHIHAPSADALEVSIKDTFYLEDGAGVKAQLYGPGLGNIYKKGLLIAAIKPGIVSFSVVIGKEQAYNCLEDMARSITLLYPDALEDLLACVEKGIKEGLLQKEAADQAFRDVCKRIDEGEGVLYHVPEPPDC